MTFMDKILFTSLNISNGIYYIYLTKNMYYKIIKRDKNYLFKYYKNGYHIVNNIVCYTNGWNVFLKTGILKLPYITIGLIHPTYNNFILYDRRLLLNIHQKHKLKSKI